MPELALAELLRFPAQVLFLRVTDLEGAISEELGVPLG
jgi:hypothetical protein